MHLVFPENHLTTKHLPQSGYLWVFGTVEVTTEESASEGVADRYGWVSSIDKPDEPVENRNDVTPLVHAALPLTRDDLDELHDLLKSMGAIESDDGSTIRSTDAQSWDLTNDEQWLYTIHASVKRVDLTTAQFVEDHVQILDEQA